MLDIGCHSHLAEISRVLHRGGDVAILNFSYRDDIAPDCHDLERLARLQGSRSRGPSDPASFWDAPAFHLVKRRSAPTRRQ